jgi:hypothetical protein
MGRYSNMKLSCQIWRWMEPQKYRVHRLLLFLAVLFLQYCWSKKTCKLNWKLFKLISWISKNSESRCVSRIYFLTRNFIFGVFCSHQSHFTKFGKTSSLIASWNFLVHSWDCGPRKACKIKILHGSWRLTFVFLRQWKTTKILYKREL